MYYHGNNPLTFSCNYRIVERRLLVLAIFGRDFSSLVDQDGDDVVQTSPVMANIEEDYLQLGGTKHTYTSMATTPCGSTNGMYNLLIVYCSFFVEVKQSFY